MVLYTRIIRYFPLSHVKMLALYTSSNQAFRWKTRYIVHITEQLQNFDYFRRLQALLYPILLTYIFFPLYFSKDLSLHQSSFSDKLPNQSESSHHSQHRKHNMKS